MPNPAPGERYTIRQKIFRVFGACFDVFDEKGQQVAYCRQKAFRLREDLRFYTGPDRANELFSMKARSILDFSTTYDVTLPTGESLGSLRRKGFRSLVRDEWTIFEPSGDDPGSARPVGRIIEDSKGKALTRRFVPIVGAFMPQVFHLEDDAGVTIARFRTHFNPFVYRLGVAIDRGDPRFDDLLILAAGCLIAAIEGRQGSNNSGSGMFSGN